MASPTVEEIAKRGCDVSNGHADDPDFAELFADPAAVWHNVDEQPMPLPGQVLASASLVLTRTTRGTLADGSQLGLSQCLINFVGDR